MPHDRGEVDREGYRTLGMLAVPSGALVACDPFFAPEALPFARCVSPGAYPVQLRRVVLQSWGPRVAQARVLFLPDVSVHAREVAERSSGSGRYLVSSGLGSFMDEASRARFSQVLAAFYRNRPAGNYYTDVLESEFERSATTDTPRAGDALLHDLPGEALNVAMFASGIGDGAYASYWALDREGRCISLVTDFEVGGAAPR
jgi:hypothetical protein